jgi:ABC-2 type transport system ATP-binding protein
LDVEIGEFNLVAGAWHVEPGTIVALVGANGSGKTTFLRTMAGTLLSRSGTWRYHGVPLSEFGYLLPELIGFLPDAVPGFGDLSMRRQFAFLRQIHRRWDDEYAQSLEERLAIPWDTPMTKLSKGTRVKAGFAMVEGHRPRVLLLDEPTGGLDPEIRLELLRVLVEAHQRDPERVTVFSTHLLEDIAEIADAVSLVRQGVVYPVQAGDSVAGWKATPAPRRTAELAKMCGVSTFA